MKFWKVTFMILVIAVACVLAYQGWTRFSDWRIGRVLVRTSWSSAGDMRWSKDGKTLYYLEECLHSYDVSSGKRMHYRSRYIYGPCDISTDGKSVIYADDKGINKVNLNNGKAKRFLFWPYIYRQKEIQNLYWLPHNRVLFTSFGKNQSIYLVDIYGKHLEKLKQMNGFITCDVGGRGFVYSDDKDRIYYYDLATRKERHVDSPMTRTPDLSYYVVYVSRHQIIYTRGDYADYAEVLNIDSKKVTKLDIDFPDIGQEMWFSPDMTNFWLMELEKGEWSPDRLYVYKTPENVLQQLRTNQRNGARDNP